VYGLDSGLKSDFGGHDNRHFNNIYLWIPLGFDIMNEQLPGHGHYFYQNKVILLKDGDYGNGQVCSGGSKTVVYGNEIFTPKGTVTECQMSLADWQKDGNDPGTTANVYPNDETISMWINTLFQLN